MADQQPIHRQPANKYGATPGRLALIGLLGIVLVVAVYWNILRQPPPNPRPVGSGARVARSDSRTADHSPTGAHDSQRSSTTSDQGVQLRTKSWPDIELAQVVAYNPFALPTAFPQPVAIVAEENEPPPQGNLSAKEQADKLRADRAAQMAAIEALRAKGVQAVFKSNEDYIAIVNGREIRIGDTIEGYTVVQISTQGITLEGNPK